MNRIILLAFSGAALLATMIVPAWADNLSTIPSPKGFIESSSLVPALKDQAANMKKEQSRKFDLSDPDVNRIVKRYVDATKERYGRSVDMNGATFLGSILETEDIYATSLIVSFSTQMDQGQVLIPLTGAVAWIRRGNQILELSDLAQFEGGQSVNIANSVLMEWLKAFAIANDAR